MPVIKVKDGILFYRESHGDMYKAYQMLKEFFIKHRAFNGECIHQCDDPIIEAPELLTNIAEKVFCFSFEYDDDA